MILSICTIYLLVFMNFSNCEMNISMVRLNDLFYSLIRPVVNEKDVSYYFLNNENDEVKSLYQKETKMSLNQTLETKFIIHGWGENSKKDWYKSMTDEYFIKGNYNIFQVDWEKPSSYYDYVRSALICKPVGEIVGKFVLYLNEKEGIPLEKIHLIGHSLGAHVAGYAGKKVESRSGRKIGRITGLDPAGPYFEIPFKNPTEGLSKNDAEVVDVIHTDGGFFGFLGPLGTVDFYVNGGVRPQPGCINISLVPPTNLDSLIPVVFCSHMKSHSYFIDSINKKRYEGVRCDSWKNYKAGYCDSNEKATFGDDLEKGKAGTYYLTTT